MREELDYVMNRWDKPANGNREIADQTILSTDKVWWKCEKGHSWKTFFSARRKTNCPYCSGRFAIVGETDLATTHPQIASEWSYSNTKSVSEVTAGSNFKAKWECRNNHFYEMKVSQRVSKKGETGCFACSSLAFLEPGISAEWHPTKNGDLCPEDVTRKSARKVWWIGGNCGHEWETRVFTRSISGCPTCNYKVSTGINDAEIVYPWLTEYWPSTNVRKLSNIYMGNKEVFAWQCQVYDHVWHQRLMTKKPVSNPCKVCSHSELLKGFNDFKTIFPERANFWDNEKNFLAPDEITIRYSKTVSWKCNKGHEWNSLLKYYEDCPVCSDWIAQKGFNDLLTTHESLVKQWDYDKNDCKPEDFTYRNSEKVWWRCELGHSWKTMINLRASKNRQTNCPYCSNNRVQPGFNDVATLCPETIQEFHPTKNEVILENFSPHSKTVVWWICNQGHEWQQAIASRMGKKLKNQKHYPLNASCYECPSSKISASEKEVSNYLSSLGFKVENNTRNIIAPQEIDMYISSKQIAVEFNGIYWHTEEQGKPYNYHSGKYQKCKDKGIQLIQVWEDDWISNPNLVKRMLAYKLGVSSERKVFARNTTARLLTQDEANSFLDENHIQGAVDGGIRVGLFENIMCQYTEKKPVAVMVLKREPGTDGKTLNLLRYATGVNVVGGFTKLLKYIEREFKPESIVTFSDNTVSDGGLYENNGFVAVRELKLDYMYVVGNRRVHKFNYRLKRFREDPALLFEEGLSERELAVLNRIPRIWDAGKVKWKKSF